MTSIGLVLFFFLCNFMLGVSLKGFFLWKNWTCNLTVDPVNRENSNFQSSSVNMVIIKVLRAPKCCWFTAESGKLQHWFCYSLSIRYFFLFFRKPIFSVEFQTSNDLIEVIPSSNPHSQTYTEEPFLLMKNGFKEDSTQDKYLKIYYGTEFKEPQQGKMLNSLFSEFWLSNHVNFCNFFAHVPETLMQSFGWSKPLQLHKV